MFTGLVEEKGAIAALDAAAGGSVTIGVTCAVVHQDVSIGDSIAINGCCLTVVTIDNQTLGFQAGEETLRRTNLGSLEIGSPVNLERALRVGDRLGGHYVSGHVDGLGRVEDRKDDAEWSEFRFEVDPPLIKQMASKGSITVDGVSLTLVDVEQNQFSVALIPHTLAHTTLGSRSVGDHVNIETDVLAKYVEQQLMHQSK